MAASEEAVYEKTDGACRNEGYNYEVKMAGLLFLRLVNEGKRFHIASNMDAAGKFDDLVLNAAGKTVFVQLKHKLGAQDSAEKRTYSVRRVFKMEKHYSSYCNLRENWEQKTDLQLWGPFSDVQFVVYTNAVVPIGKSVEDSDVQKVLMTGGKCLRLSENDFPGLKNEPDFNQFLHQFRFCTEQASERQLDSLIRTELLRALGTDSQFQTFLTNITSWMEGPGSYLTENVEFWKDIVKCSVDDLSRAKIDQLAKFNLQFDERELNLFRQQFPEGGGLLRVQNSNALTCLKLHQSIDEKILVDGNVLKDRMSEVLALWGRWPGCDVLVIDGWVEAIEKLLQHLGSGKVLVVIHDSVEERELISLIYRDEFCFGQLDEESKQRVLQCRIDFQGESIKLSSLVDSTVLNQVATADIVTQVLSGYVESFGGILTQQYDYYIPRNFFRKEHVSEAIFSDNGICLVVSGVSQEYLNKLVPCDKKIEKFDEMKHYRSTECRCFVIEGQEEFEKASNVFDEVHWLHKEDTGFILKKTKGSISKIKFHMMDKISNRSLEEVMLLSDRIKLIVANPGMGKSTEIVNVAQEFKRSDSTCWVVTIMLNDYTDYLSKFEESEEYEVELLSQAGKFTGFARLLFTHELKNAGNIVFLIDGFDEISPDYADTVLHMLSRLMKYKFKQMWITSRSVMKEMLEKEFFCLPFQLQPFTNENQRDFLAKLWSNINNGSYNLDIFIDSLLKATGESFSDKPGHFTEIPLQIHMLAEVFQTDASQYCQSGEMIHHRKLDLLELYNRFVDRKWNICMGEKGRVDVTKPVQRQLLQSQWEECEKDHMTCAVHSLLSTEDLHNLQSSEDIMRRVECFQDRFEKGNDKVGIVTRIVNSRAVFIHRTFLEFFAAKWFTKKIETETEYLNQILFNKEFKIVREFFDRILAQGFALHTAILNEDKQSVCELLLSPECAVNERDKGGRTPLHLAVINHTESDDVAPDNVTCAIIELLLQHHPDCGIEDEVFRWRPLTLADKLQAWSAVDMLLNNEARRSDMIFSMQLIKSEGFIRRVLKIVASRGYINIAKFMFENGLHLDHPVQEVVDWRAVTATVLHIAAGAGQTKLLEFLLESAETRDSNTRDLSSAADERPLEIKDSLNRTALAWAVREGRTETVRLLIAKGANVNAQDSFCNTPLLDANFSRDVEIVKFLIENDADVKACNEFGLMPILAAMESGNEHLVRLLIEKGANVTAWVERCNCPVFNAASFDAVNFVRLLTEKGTDINALNKFGQTPLFAAVASSNVHLVSLLLCTGANAYACNENSDTPIFAAVEGGNLEILWHLIGYGANVNASNVKGDSPIFTAVESGDADVVMLLIKAGSDVMMRNREGDSPVFTAAKCGNLDIVRLLVEYGANVNQCNVKDESPIFAAVQNGNLEVLTFLIECGANVNTCNIKGDTPIFAAVESANLNLLWLLTESGASINARNMKGDGPIFAAVKSGNLDIVRFLIQCGAKVNERNVEGDSPIYAAVENGNLDVVRYLIECGAYVSECNVKGDSPIFAAVENGNLDVVRFLIECGAYVSECNVKGDSPIFAAVKSGNLDVVRFLIECGAKVNESNVKGDSPIFAAVKSGNLDIVRFLIECGANVSECNVKGDSPIFAAVKSGNLDVVRYLIECGAKVNERNVEGDSPIFAAVENGNLDVVRFLIECGAKVNESNVKGDSPIFPAVKSGNLDVVRFLIECGANVDAYNIKGDSPIFAAVESGNSDLVRFLIDCGVYVNERNVKGNSPMFAAVESGNVDVVKLLIECGGNVNVCNIEGDTPIFAAVRSSRPNVDVLKLLTQFNAYMNTRNVKGNSVIFPAVESGNLDAVKFLIEFEADINARNIKGDSPIFAAVESGNLAIVRLLIKNGANVTARNINGNSPIFAAVESGNFGIVKLLIEHGANVNERNVKCYSPIFAAMENANVDLVKLLLEAGADVMACNKDGVSPISIATECGSVELLTFLNKVGVDVNVCNKSGNMEEVSFSIERDRERELLVFNEQKELVTDCL
ncbi:uncharacterized protein [Periplaneta americana]|uniref:uncharacterized protein n=1 Tax=Periplaneta americana TaxID=6978 RepID=UPI0037E90050